MNRHKKHMGPLALAVLLVLALLATPIKASSPAPETGPWMAQTGINRDGKLDPAEIAQLARSVVLVGNVRDGDIWSTGSGTIISPEGLILTNAHVVERAEQVVIGILDDLNDPPEWRYLGTVATIDTHIDVALIQLRSDIKGRSLRSSPNLPYGPTRIATVSRGDIVYIFGYPGIGDYYLVVTQGNIASIENGNFNGRRMPIWYRTDAEIAPGNSGGLAVNGNGEFVGIPTSVQIEYDTGGRLGGIRPAQMVLAAAQNAQAPSQQARRSQSPPACVSAPHPRMIVDHFGRVTFTTGEPVRVRTGPGTNYRILTLLPEGATFYVIDGPVCANGYWWWLVQIRRGVTGWMAEGVVGNYFIEPYTP